MDNSELGVLRCVIAGLRRRASLCRECLGSHPQSQATSSHDLRNTVLWVDVRESARKHGISDEDLSHAIEHAVTVVELEPDADPPKVLPVGPDGAGRFLEVIWLELDRGDLVIHAMPLRPNFFDLLPDQSTDHD